MAVSEIKRFTCFLMLILFLSFASSAINLDGKIHTRTEYTDKVLLQSENHISNNAVENAFLYWFNDPVDYSLYLAVNFSCKDFVPDGGKSGVEVSINDRLCTTFYANGTMDDVDPNFFNVESVFYIQQTEPMFIQNEMRIGIKYGYREDITVGIRILDCSGNPSNYYVQTVYSAPDASTESVTQSEKETSETQTEKTTTTTTSAASKNSTTKPIITAAVCTSASPTTAKPIVTKPTTANRKSSTTKLKTTQPKNTSTQKQSTTNERSVPSETECTTDSTESTLSLDAQTTIVDEQALVSYKFYRMKSLGTALATSLITAAVMISLFVGIGRKKRTHQTTSEEEHQDFG